MFGFGGKENEAVVGARQKMLRARQMKGLAPGQALPSNNKEDQQRVFISVVLIFIMATLLAVMLTNGVLVNGLGFDLFSSGSTLNRLLFGPGVPSVYGDDSINYFVVILIRGMAIFCGAAFLPVMTRLWNRLRDNAQGNVYVSFCGVTIGLPFLYYFIMDYFWPLILKIAGVQ